MQLREVTERYRLDKILRSTRSGTVLRAIDSQSGQAVVVKLITVGTSPGLAGVPKFQALAAALAEAHHPNLPEVLDSGFTPDGSAFLVLPFLEGRNFDTLAGGPPANILPLLMQALDGLEALARRGVAHHNLSPDNLLVIPSPGGPQVKLLGLGSAIFHPPDSGSNASFRAPELGAGPGTPADWRADLYSFALTACRALGATESLGEGDPNVQMPFALSFELENAEGIRQVLEQCLRQRPEERPAHAVIRQAFRPALAGGEPAWREKTNPMLIPPAVPAASAPIPEPLRPAPPAAVPPAQPAAATPPPPRPAAPPVQLVPPASAAPAAPGAPKPPAVQPPPVAPAPPAEAELDGDLFPAITDDILNALPDDWQAGAPSPGAPAGAGRVLPFGKGTPVPTAPGAAVAAAPPAKPGLLRRPFVLGGIIAALVLVLAAAMFLGVKTKQPIATADVPSGPAAAAPPPPKPAGERLQEAEAFFAQREDFRARQILLALSAADQAMLTPEECQRLSRLQQTLVLSAGEQLPSDLKEGFANGDLDHLRNAVAAAADVDVPSLPAQVQEDLTKARAAVDLYEKAEAAAGRKEHVAVLDDFGALAALLPKVKDSQDLREKAATVLESEAQALVEAGKYPEAVARLQPLQHTWPDRAGLKERIASYERYRLAEQEQKALLEKLPSMERRRKPNDALEVLRTVEPVPHYVAQFAAARKRLEDQLAQLDKAPPQITLREGYYLEYARGMVANLSFRVTDDYEVKSVKMMARAQGGKMREMPLKKSTFAYTAEISPAFHQNGTVDFYVVATDISGHEGSLGSRDKPLQVKRTQGFEGFVR